MFDNSQQKNHSPIQRMAFFCLNVSLGLLFEIFIRLHGPFFNAQVGFVFFVIQYSPDIFFVRVGNYGE